MNLNRDKIKNDLKAFIYENDLKHKEMGELAGVSDSTISRICKGEPNVSKEMLIAIVEVLKDLKDKPKDQILKNNISRNTDNFHFEIDKVKFECSKKYLHLLRFENNEDGKIEVRII